MQIDTDSGLPFFVCHETGKNLYRHSPCRICGTSRWVYSTRTPADCDATCVCHPSRRERNDNFELISRILS